MEQLDKFMAGEPSIMGFSGGTLSVFVAIILLSGVASVLARRLIFPMLMDILSKTDRIDGKTLFAPKSLGWMIGFLVMHLAIDWIATNSEPVWDEELMSTVSSATWAAFVLLMLLAAYRLVDYLDAFIVVEGDDMAARRSLASVAESVGRLAVVVAGVFIIAGLSGMDLNGLIAGLGITGLALALAAKDSVANVFGAISILIDKPFNVGDWIVVEDVEGEVVSIGLRTTLIRTSADTMVSIPNSNITNSPVENFSQRRFRRIRPTLEFEADSDQASLRKFCDSLCSQILDDPRATKPEDSWARVQSFAPSKVTVATNFYCGSSGKTQRELTEDILMMARARASEHGLKFHEPRRREHQSL